MTRKFMVLVVLGVFVSGMLGGCRSSGPSTFVNQSMRSTELMRTKYRVLKQAAMGESNGFTLVWIPFAHATEAEAKQDLLDRLRKEGIETQGKKIAFANAMRDRGGFSLIGIIATPVVKLTADVIEVLDETETPQRVEKPAQ